MGDEQEMTNRQPTVSLAQSIGVAVGFALVALIVRALIYFNVENVLHADEAVQGLMARHILGGSVQLFTYGFPFLGTLQAHLIALGFALFGSSVAVLKWTAGIESLLLVAANCLLAREVGGGDRRAGWIAAFLTAIGPLYLIQWSLRPRGGHLEVATLSALAFWALLRAFRSAGASRRWLAACAFLLGLGWWVHLTMFYAIVACLIAIVVWRKHLAAQGAWLWTAIASLVCFLAGSLPFWLYNLKYPGRTFGWLWGAFRAGDADAGLFNRLWGTASTAIPILLGSRQTEAGASFGLAIVLLSLGAYAAAVLLALIAATRRPTRHAVEAARELPSSGSTRKGVALLLLFSAVALAGFVVGPFSFQLKDPCALLPLYGALAPLMAVGIAVWRTAGGFARQAVMVLLPLLGILHVSGYRRAQRDVVQPRMQEQPVPSDLESLRFFLEGNEIRLIYTNFLVGYRLAFETEESIVACTEGDPGPERYPPYAEKVRAAKEPVPLIVSPRMAEWLEADLKRRGIGFAVATVQDFRVFHRLTAPYRDYPPGPQICVPAKIEVGEYPKQCRPGEKFPVPVKVTNRSSIAWPPPPSWRAVLLTYHLLDPDSGRRVRYENPRFPLGKTVSQGESVTVTMEVQAPSSRGRCAFVPDLVIEGVGWFSTFQSDLREKSNWREFSVATSR